uniref:Uncharacterized protein n=1 Tax=Zea mays TaxID=4577 RepID=A0A804M9Z5_MAIZE
MDKINQRLPPRKPLGKPKRHRILNLNRQMRGHEHDATLLPVLRDDVFKQPGTLCVQRDGGLVQQPDGSIDGEQPGELQPLPLPHGQHPPGLLVHEPAELHELDGRARPAAVLPLEELEPLDVLEHCELLFHGVLERHPVELQLVLLEDVGGGDVVSVPEDLPRRGARKPASMRRRVVFPEPLAPVRTRAVPSWTLRLMSQSTFCAFRMQETLLSRSRGGM